MRGSAVQSMVMMVAMTSRAVAFRGVWSSVRRASLHDSHRWGKVVTGRMLVWPAQRRDSWMGRIRSTDRVDEEIDPGVVEGTDLQILKYPHPSLRKENEEFTEFTSEISSIARQMFKVMYASKGVGLAAPQVGINKRLMVFNPEGDPTRWLSEVVLVNPRIVDRSDATDEEEEACLSFPGMSGKVIRSKWIKVEAYTPKGKKLKRKYVGWEARIFQHEYDHLERTVYIDRLSEEERKQVQPVLDKLIVAYGEGGAL